MSRHSTEAPSFAEYNFLLCAVPPTFSNFIYIYYFIKIKILYKDSERGGTWHNSPQTRINSRFLLCHPIFAKWHRGPKWHTKWPFLPIFTIFDHFFRSTFRSNTSSFETKFPLFSCHLAHF